jgi:hypothetical protein
MQVRSDQESHNASDILAVPSCSSGARLISWFEILVLAAHVLKASFSA